MLFQVTLIHMQATAFYEEPINTKMDRRNAFNCCCKSFRFFAPWSFPFDALNKGREGSNMQNVFIYRRYDVYM